MVASSQPGSGERQVVIEFEPTPNPDAINVRPGRVLSVGSPQEYKGAPANAGDPLAAALLKIDGVARVMIGRNWFSVIRESADFPWADLKAEIAFALADVSEQTSQPKTIDQAEKTPDDRYAHFSDLELEIDQVLERWVRPLLEADGGRAVLERFDPEDGVAWVRMEGACGGCPSSSLTLNRLIEQAVRKWVPEVRRVRAVTGEARPVGDAKARFRDWIAGKWGAV